MNCEHCDEHAQVEHLSEWKKSVDKKLDHLCVNQTDLAKQQRGFVTVVQYRWITGILISVMIFAGGSIYAGLNGMKSAILSVGTKIETLAVEVRKENERTKARLDKEEVLSRILQEKMLNIDKEFYLHTNGIRRPE